MGPRRSLSSVKKGKLETCPEIAGMGIYLKTSGPGLTLEFLLYYIIKLPMSFDTGGGVELIKGAAFLNEP